MIKHFIQKINSRWRKIDYVFSSYGGASYFPNAVHFSKKNDLEIAETRELFFVTNFCKIIEGLNPTYAIPFATDFILLDDNQRWINKIKFPRDQIKTLYNQYTKASSAVQIIEAYPNDYFEQDHFFAVSPYHAKKENKSLLETIDSDYAEEIAEKKNPKKLSVSEQETLFKQIEAHILSKQYIIPEEVRKKIKFAVKITDGRANNVLTIDFRHNATIFSKAAIAEKDVDLLIEIKSQTIDYAINNEWGGDAIIIGYGAEVYIYNFDAVLFEYENYCIRLLSRYPNTKEYLRKTPFRALKYLISDEIKRKNLLNKALGQKDKIIDYTDALLGKRDLWLNKNKCDVCKACNI